MYKGNTVVDSLSCYQDFLGSQEYLYSELQGSVICFVRYTPFFEFDGYFHEYGTLIPSVVVAYAFDDSYIIALQKKIQLSDDERKRMSYYQLIMQRQGVKIGIG